MRANTDEMRRIASEINSLAVQYQTLISGLYTKFSEMPTVTKEWIGNKAQEYVGYVMLDKPDMLSVGDKIKSFANAITDDANQLDSNISKIRKDEAK